MKLIITLTLNSSVDAQWSVPAMEPIKKLRASAPLTFPGGGGINVSRVIRILGGQSIAIHTAGGFTGHFFREMVEAQGLLTRTITIAENTRVSATVFDDATGLEYRVTPPGPELSESEWMASIDALFEYEPDYVVATGSLPRGVPTDYYVRVSNRAKELGARLILDTSGQPLAEALETGVFLVKPNLGELQTLVGRTISDADDQESVCRQIVEEGKAEVVALTMGDDGALLVSGTETVRLSTPKVEVKSAVGAGDSFVGGLTYGLAKDLPLRDAFGLGVSTGTASVLTAGTELCNREDVERLFEEIIGHPLSYPA